jgi:broad specificity phosphatase PhoE
VDETMYCRVPDPEIALTRKGHAQAAEAGQAIRELCEREGTPYKLFFYISPYKRTKQTAAGVASAFRTEQVMGVREEPQLREQARVGLLAFWSVRL